MIIRGRRVDVSSFRHPGGNVIEFYSDMDATNAFETFHGHSARAEAVLKTLPSTPVDEPQADMVTALRDYHVMWRGNGLYRAPSDATVFGMCLGLTCLCGLGVGLAPISPGVAGVVLGCAWTWCGFAQHAAGHRSLGPHSKVVQDYLEGFLKGGSASWWNARHSKHHAKTNVIDEDGDLRTTPLFAWDDELARRMPTVALQWQTVLFVPLLALYVFVFAVTVRRYVVLRHKWTELSLIAAHALAYAAAFAATECSLRDAVAAYAIGYAVEGLYLGLTFSLSHFACERLAHDATWIESTLKGTVDWATTSPAMAWLTGFLNLQIEHHMAPQMPMHRLPLIRQDCMRLARRFDLPYQDVGDGYEAFRLTIDGLRRTADKELRRRRTSNE